MPTIEHNFDEVEVKRRIDDQIANNRILLYMKGVPQQPACGFSARAVRVLDACGVGYASVNILENPDIRAILPKYKEWPTFPQLYIDGELIGGSDILLEMYENGELPAIFKSKNLVINN